MNVNKSIVRQLSLLFSVLITSSIWSQQVNHVEYEILLKTSRDNNESHYDLLIPNLESKLKQVVFDLDFDNSISRFRMNNNLLSSDDKDIILDIADMIGDEYYNRIDCDTIYAKNQKVKKLFNRTCYSIIKTDWFVTSEQKTINGYLCTKAITTLEKDYGDGEKIKVYDIVAWFCPELKSSFGPKSYKGLKGLILELEQPLVVFRALKLDYSTKIDSFSIPNKSIVSEASLFENIGQ